MHGDAYICAFVCINTKATHSDAYCVYNVIIPGVRKHANKMIGTYLYNNIDRRVFANKLYIQRLYAVQSAAIVTNPPANRKTIIL